MPAAAIAPLVAAQAKPALEQISKILDVPVVGVRRKVIRTTKKRVIETDYSLQIRGWEALGAGLGAAALYILAIDRGVIPRPTGSGLSGNIPGYGPINLTPLSPLPIEILFPWLIPLRMVMRK